MSPGTGKAQEQSDELQAILDYLAPYPWKQRILLEEYLHWGPQSPVFMRLSAQAREIASPSAANVIDPLASWNVGRQPNYTDGYVAEGVNHILVACFDSHIVNHVNTATGVVTELDTGPDTNPLDVAYDEERNRVVVASADVKGQLIVLDSTGSIIETIALADVTSQGTSYGGAQGVIIDADGNYWVTLAYYGLQNKGALVKLSGETLEVLAVIKNVGLNNPNGITTSEDGQMVFAFSDNGFAQQFDLEGTLQATIETLPLGYRGTVRGDDLWVTGWLAEGSMIKYNLKTHQRSRFPCAPLGNSIKVDADGYVWVAGDGGVSVSTPDGQLMAVQSFGAYTNGLTTLGNDVYFISYDQKLHHVRKQPYDVFLPIVIDHQLGG